MPALLTLSDVMGTGHHAALAAGVRPGCTVAVVGDGAVGLCGVLAARRLGAERIIAMSRHADRQEVAAGSARPTWSRSGARTARARWPTCPAGSAPTRCSSASARGVDEAGASDVARRRRRRVRRVPHGVGLPVRELFGRNVSVGGGVAPARAYLPELLADVVAGTLDPSPVFDLELGLDDVAEGYRAMHERRAIKVLVRP